MLWYDQSDRAIVEVTTVVDEKVTIAMNAQFPDTETIREVLTLATRAPSIHNTQPWSNETEQLAGSGQHVYA